MSKRTPPESIAWLHHAAAAGQSDARLMLQMLERLEALERRPIPGTVELAAKPAPPAGALVERVAARVLEEVQKDVVVHSRLIARAAIREVAEWLDSDGCHATALRLRKEANRG